MQHFVFGGKGFIGQNLCKELISFGEKVVVVDKNIWGNEFVFPLLHQSDLFSYLELDINKDKNKIKDFISKSELSSKDTVVWHLAANSDIQSGVYDVSLDLENTFQTTISILDIMRSQSLNKIIFSSSSAVYGAAEMPHGGYTEASPTQPISNYGAMKLASEAIIRSAFEQWLQFALVFRFPNVIGYPATHGAIFDFIKKLQIDGSRLEVLGNGMQNKPYLHVSDLVDAMLNLVGKKVDNTFNIFNIASTFPNVYVHEIAQLVVERVAPNAEIRFGHSAGGWIGDMPQVEFNISKLIGSGWCARMSGHEAVIKTVEDNLSGKLINDYH